MLMFGKEDLPSGKKGEKMLTVLTTEIRLSKPQVQEEYMMSFMHIFSTNKVPRVVL
jgi:hypothetical protein